jgi:hypothetical protein
MLTGRSPMIIDIFLIVALVSMLWMVIGLQMRLKLARNELLDVQHRVLKLERKLWPHNVPPEDQINLKQAFSESRVPQHSPCIGLHTSSGRLAAMPMPQKREADRQDEDVRPNDDAEPARQLWRPNVLAFPGSDGAKGWR